MSNPSTAGALAPAMASRAVEGRTSGEAKGNSKASEMGESGTVSGAVSGAISSPFSGADCGASADGCFFFRLCRQSAIHRTVLNRPGPRRSAAAQSACSTTAQATASSRQRSLTVDMGGKNYFERTLAGAGNIAGHNASASAKRGKF